jgi:hypothetical protein
MRTPPLNKHDTREQRTIKRQQNKKRNNLYGVVAVVIVTILGLLFIGMKIQESRTPDRLPANAACAGLAEKLPIHLQANINAQFGTPVPEGTPSADEINKLKADCIANQEKYEVVVVK